MTISHYKIYSKSPFENHFYQSFVGEPLCVQLINRIENKLKKYFNDQSMNLNQFVEESKLNHSACVMSYVSAHIGLFKHKDPRQQLYQMGSKLNNNEALKKLEQYLDSQLLQPQQIPQRKHTAKLSG